MTGHQQINRSRQEREPQLCFWDWPRGFQCQKGPCHRMPCQFSHLSQCVPLLPALPTYILLILAFSISGLAT